jgi:hypothetical protein
VDRAQAPPVLPFPGKYSIGLGTWAVSTFLLPDEKLVCREFASVPIRLGVNRSGRLTATAGDVFPVIRKVSNSIISATRSSLTSP